MAGCSGQGKDKQNANKASTDLCENPNPSRTLPTSNPNGKTEYTDKASSTATLDTSNTTANYNWNADMGASAHMTPN